MLFFFLLISCPAGLLAQSEIKEAEKEEDYYRIKTVAIPQHILLEVGGMTFLPDDALAVSTRRGEVWIIHNPYMKNGRNPQYKLFARGMHEVLGLNYIKGDLYLTQRSEITRLRDLDGDGEADEYRTMYSWPLSGNYHEYAYGPVLDKDSNMVVALNLGWADRGVSLSKWKGWMLKFDKDFNMKPFAAGLRSPAGFALNDEGDIFYSENQGDWVGSGSITYVAEGDFLGNPASLRWSGEPGSPVKLKESDIPDTGEPKFEVAKRVPGLKTPSVWFPHTILGISTSGILNYDEKGRMGPFKGQLFVGDQGHSKIMRVALEKVKGVYQGTVFPFREGFSSGILRMNWGSDGSMFVGMTSRGWWSTGGKLFGLQRLEWTGKTPFEIKTIQAKPDGFELEFTKPVDVKSALDAASYSAASFTYKYHHIYGSPAINHSELPLKALEVSEDRMKVRLAVDADSLKEGYIYEIKAEGIRSGDNSIPLLHNFGYYTLNRIPDGQKLAITEKNRVVPPVHHHPAPEAAKTKVPDRVKTTAVKPAARPAKRLTKQPADWTSGPDNTIILGTKPGLKFDKEEITLKAGAKVKLVFNNNDDMQHNFILTTPGAGNEVGELALKLGVNGERLNYVPSTSKVLHYTIILQPGKSDTIYFTAPDKPGLYPYICSYPGHFYNMKGVMRIVK